MLLTASAEGERHLAQRKNYVVAADTACHLRASPYYKRARNTACYTPLVAFETLCELWCGADKILNSMHVRALDIGARDARQGKCYVDILLAFYRHWDDITDRLLTSQFFEDVLPGRREALDACDELADAFDDLCHSCSAEAVQRVVTVAANARQAMLAALIEEGNGRGGITTYPTVFASCLAHLEHGTLLVALFSRHLDPMVYNRRRFARRAIFPCRPLLIGWFKYVQVERTLRSEMHKVRRFETAEKAYRRTYAKGS